ncbi:MAG: AAA family ATPase, partial [Phycisphaerae bacterium]|nr:AAA family ATPase [Phycisphaerae bacterium]
AELDAWLANAPDALCLLCGAVSGHLEALDFDQGGELFDAWCKAVPAALLGRLVISATPSGGWHVVYRCSEGVCGNLKLAQRKTPDGIVTLIETRGAGGLVLCAPTAGYEVAQGDPAHPPVLTASEREALLSAAWALNEYDAPQAPTAARSAHTGQRGADTGRPGDDYNARGDVRALLEAHGWVRTRDGANEHWCRPGKARGTSATLKDGVFHVFSSNAAPFEPDGSYAPFAVYALLEHAGDYEQAARALRAEGYGSDAAEDGDVDISAIVDQAGAPTAEACGADGSPEIRCLQDLLDDFDGLNPPVIHGMLREGETMNVIASPKMGKSWFVSTLATCIASGLDWLGHSVEPGRVLHIDNELHQPLLSYRYGVISEALGLPYRLYSRNIDTVSLRGQLRDLYALGGMFEKIEPGTYKLIVIDAFYRTLPPDTDENDNGAMANLYNRIDAYAAKLGCAFALVHHTSKGNQSGKAVTDVGAGAGSQARAADAHLVLRPHQEDGIVVLDCAVRSWPPIEPMALARKGPLFEPVDEVDTSALLGAAKPRAKPAEPGLDDFVAQCIGPFDPCSKACVHYEAARRFELPERKAEQMLELAIERGDVAKLRVGSRMKYVVCRVGITGDKALRAAAILTHEPDIDMHQVAEKVELSQRHLRRIKAQLAGEGQ